MAFADSALSLANGSYLSVLAGWHTAGAYKIKRVSLSGFTLSLKPLLLRGFIFHLCGAVHNFQYPGILYWSNGGGTPAGVKNVTRRRCRGERA
jgi:hypothetical protein